MLRYRWLGLGLWLLIVGSVAYGLPDDLASLPVELRGLQPPYSFSRYSMPNSYELWIVGGRGQLIHLTPNKADKRSLSNEDLSGVFFINATKGWIVGDNGTILYSESNGNRWVLQSAEMKNNLKAVTCSDATHCWVVGNDGAILKTIDSGLRWTISKAGVADDLYAVDFINHDIGWAVGEDGLVLHTNGAGKTWREQRVVITMFPDGSFAQPADWKAVHFANEKTGWIAGSGGIARTSDGGKTWQTQVFEEGFIGLISSGTENVWAIGSAGKNYHSENAGRTWEVVN